MQKGHIEVFQIAHCGLCIETKQIPQNKIADEYLKSKGWDYNEKRGWICPTCVKDETIRINRLDK